MYLVIVIFVITAIVVYLVRRMEVDNAWTLAIISGALIQIAGLFVGYIVLGVTGKTLWLIAGNIISLLIAFILQFLPKKMVAVREVTVKHFGNTASMGKRIDHSRSVLSPEEEENSRKVIAKELDIDEDLLK